MGHLNKSLEMYKKALKISPNNTKLEYSYSLLLIKLKRYNEALAHAKRSYKLGSPPSALRNKLIKIGVWK